MSYSKFKQYGKSFSEHYWGDFIHNIWLRYFEKHGKDVFEEKKSNRWIYIAVRWEFLRSLYRSEQFEDIVKEHVESGDLEEILVDASPSPIDILIYNELDEFIKKKIRSYVLSSFIRRISSPGRNLPYDLDAQYERFISVYERMKFNYSEKEIAEDLQISTALVSYYKKQIREAIKMGSWVNPFNGSKVKVTRTITQKQWENKYDPSDYDQEDSNEFYSLYVHKESGEGLLVRLSEERDMSFLLKY